MMIAANNRLIRYEEYDDSGQSPVLTRTVWYVYYQTGNVASIVVKDAYTGSRLLHPPDPLASPPYLCYNT
jgi:hypothetical protein